MGYIENIFREFTAIGIPQPELHLMIDRNPLEPEEDIVCFSCHPLLRILPVVVADDELCEFRAKRNGAIAGGEDVDGYGFKSGIACHLDVRMMGCCGFG